MKVLLLNPPGRRLYLRDYYCAKISKAYYLPQPVDLLMQSGYFHEAGADLRVCDAIAERASAEDVLAAAEAQQPDLILTMCGAVSFEEDRAFLSSLKERLPQTRILASGDVFLEDPAGSLREHPWLDGVITHFFGDGPLAYAQARYPDIRGLVYRLRGEVVVTKNPDIRRVSLPMPRHELFQGAYRYAFADAYPMATVLTNYACPYPCSFCVMSQLGYAVRPAQDVIAELQYLADLGVRYIYFSDQTFFADAAETTKILNWMIEAQPGFRFCCFSRVDRLDHERLTLMKRAGCNVVMFGVEWSDQAMLEKYRKNTKTERVFAAFQQARALGLKTLGTFLLGAPGEDAASIRATIELALQLDCDYASFNVAVPRPTTAFAQEARALGLASEGTGFDQSGVVASLGTGVLSPTQVAALHREAVLRFYLRPGYLLRRLFGIRSFAELKTHGLEAFYLFKGAT